VARLRKVRYLRGLASIASPNRLTVALEGGGDEPVDADAIILATGSEPVRPEPLAVDSSRVLDSTSALDLPEVPATMLVVGGGYIGLELGSVYAALGTRVSVVEMTDGLLPGVDRDLVRYLAQRLEKAFDRVMLSARVAAMRASASALSVTFEGEGTPPETAYDYVLVAVGRRPNARIPGLERTRVQITDRGFIQTDAQRRTAEPTVFAIGDVAGEPMLAHKASHEARVAVEAIAGHKAVFEPLAIPAVVFTDPEIAWAGLTETQAEREGRGVEVTRFPWGASGRAIAIDRTDGLTKLLVDPQTRRVLGLGIVGSGAGELIAEGVLAIEMGATAADVKLTIHPHPTLTETIMESAEQVFGTATHVYKPKRK
jgi:dihydrolipoamide dehydrogenase